MADDSKSSSARRIKSLDDPFKLAAESLASNRPWQCWQITGRPKYSTRTCKLRPQVGHSCTK
jgi:hypothetical protein